MNQVYQHVWSRRFELAQNQTRFEVYRRVRDEARILIGVPVYAGIRDQLWSQIYRQIVRRFRERIM